MKVFEIKNFAKGYDDSVSPEYAPVESTQDSLFIDYSRVPGALSRAYADQGSSSGLDWDENANGDWYQLLLFNTVYLIYEGRLDTGAVGGNWTNKRIMVGGGKVWQYCPGDQVIPLGQETAVFGKDDYPDAVHYIDNFYISGGYNYAIRKWNGLNFELDVIASLDGAAAGNNRYRCKYLEVFHDRLWMGNTYESSDAGVTWTAIPHRLRFSHLANASVWNIEDLASTDANWIDIQDKDGDEVVRIKTFGDELIVFKRNSIH